MNAGTVESPARVIVVGSVNIDTTLRVPALVTPGETVLATDTRTAVGGKGANQAVAAAALGPGVALIGVVGTDPQGVRARAALEDAGVDTTHLRSVQEPTGSAVVMVDESGENMIVVTRGANGALDPATVNTAVRQLAGTGAVVVASLEIPIAAVLAAAEGAAARNAIFMLNPAPAVPLDAVILRRCDVLVPNATELEQLGGVRSLLDMGVRTVVTTRGRHGAEISRAGAATIRVAAPGVDAVDSTGAGDAFVGALAVALRDRLDLEKAVEIAVVAGAVATTGVGAQGANLDRSRLAGLGHSNGGRGGRP